MKRRELSAADIYCKFAAQLDEDGFRLYHAAQRSTGFQPYDAFPYAANPNHPEQDAKTKEMSLRLLEACQQVNVYGSVWTDEMWDEIHHASKLGIPMMTDQKTIGRTPPRRSGRKER